jgi:ABC-type multidrug transport system ATPase subunit
MIKEEKLEAGTAHTAPSQGVSIDVFDVTYGVVVDGKVKRLLKNVNCSFNSGSMVALMGPSGAGKR